MNAHVYISNSVAQGEEFVLSGRVVSGEVEAGMEMVIGANSALGLVVVIDEVERGDGSGVRLVVRGAEQVEILAGLGVREEEVEVRAVG